jgi:hypothetical protein
MKPNRTMRPMRDICSLLWCALVGLFRSRTPLDAEILLLRHQLNVLRRMAFTDVDRLEFARLYHLAPGVLNALKIIKPETVIRWHRRVSRYVAYVNGGLGSLRSGLRVRIEERQ